MSNSVFFVSSYILVLRLFFQSDDTEGEREEALSTGYVDIQALLKMDKFRGFSLEDVKKVVELYDKQRFSLKQRSKDGAWMIRANQGHTIRVGTSFERCF